MEDDYIRAALEFVNATRARYGLGEPLAVLPRGVPGDGYKCPIARGLGDGWLVDGRAAFRFDEVNDPDERLSALAEGFTEKFDVGDYPHLVDA